MSLIDRYDADRYRTLLRLRWAGVATSEDQDELDALTERLGRLARAWRECGGSPPAGLGDDWHQVEA